MNATAVFLETHVCSGWLVDAVHAYILVGTSDLYLMWAWQMQQTQLANSGGGAGMQFGVVG